MTWVRHLLVSALLALALPAWAGPVEDAGADVARAGAKLSEAAARRQALQADLDSVAARIEAIKRRDGKDRPVLADGSLDGDLRRSQELAVQLSTAARAEDAARSEQASAATQLVGLCDGELGTLRGAIARRDPQAMARAAELSARRDQARALLPRQVVVAPPSGNAPSDDPRELRERADLLRDQHDRLLTRVAELDRRIAERTQQADLNRAMGSFLRQGALFDENRRVVSAPAATAASPAASPGGAAAFQDKAVGDPRTFLPQSDGQSTAVQPAPSIPAPAPTPPVVSAAVPAFGGDARGPGAGLQPLSADASLPDLEAARASLLRQARSLEIEAAGLDARARSLGSGK